MNSDPSTVPVARLDMIRGVESDEALVRRATSDPAAFAELYERYLPLIDRYCRTRLREADQVEDVVHQIFLKVIEGLRRQRIEHFRPWLWTICRHEVVDTYRRRRPDVGLATVIDVHSSGQSPEEWAVAQDNANLLQRLILQLPRSEQTLMELRLFGLTNDEICQALGKKPGWVWTTQHRAIGHLRALLDQEQGREAIR